MSTAPYAINGEPFVGGLAKVFRATHPLAPGKTFAVKVPRFPDRPELVARFVREARVLTSVSHPNIIRLVEARLDAAPPFLVFEFCALGSLRRLVGRVPLEFGLLVLRDIASSLDAFHSRGGFHRDVKPDNVLLKAGGEVVLSDMNLANL